VCVCVREYAGVCVNMRVCVVATLDVITVEIMLHRENTRCAGLHFTQ